MSNPTPSPQGPLAWAHFRFSVIGPLLAAPPSRGELYGKLQELAAQRWRHPMSGEWVQFGTSTLERWYYRARREKHDPVTVLQRKLRSDQGQHPSLSAALCEVLTTQYHQHPHWSVQLHADNLKVRTEDKPELGPMPSYASIRRFLRAHGLDKRPRRGPVHSPGAQRAEQRFQEREIRSYQSEYVNALWHLDFHHGSLRVLAAGGQWVYPILLGILDDCSRLCAHVQWYLHERSEDLCHGLSQAIQKRALPRALMTDNGAAMVAAETRQGLVRLGIHHEPTLAFSPYQNGKKEVFWAQIEGRLLPMLEGVADLTLAQLNEATLAWLEMEYHRKPHSELHGRTPLQCYLDPRDVGRPSPSSEELRLAFTAQLTRRQRRSDGTITIEGVRFEIPSRFGHLRDLSLRYASWDLTKVHLCDPQTGVLLTRIFPQDKARNAQGARAPRVSPNSSRTPVPPPTGMAPLLQKILHQYATTGLPPAYLPKDELP